MPIESIRRPSGNIQWLWLSDAPCCEGGSASCSQSPTPSLGALPIVSNGAPKKAGSRWSNDRTSIIPDIVEPEPRQCHPAASRRLGLSRNWTPALLSATIADSNSHMSISRMSWDGDRRRSCSRGMKREGLRSILPSCQICYCGFNDLRGRPHLYEVDWLAGMRRAGSR